MPAPSLRLGSPDLADTALPRLSRANCRIFTVGAPCYSAASIGASGNALPGTGMLAWLALHAYKLRILEPAQQKGGCPMPRRCGLQGDPVEVIALVAILSILFGALLDEPTRALLCKLVPMLDVCNPTQ